MLVPDTKFDLTINPSKFLGTSLHLWDPSAAFGQVQNQAYGYLWPMGPFFLLGTSLGVDGWILQRLWIALVLVVAFLGATRVLQALGIRRDAALIIGGLAYALSPRILTTIGPISIEAWPSALAPWVLLPLIHGSRTGSPRRAAALSALMIGMVGGVNAAATFAVIPLGVVWLLTRQRGVRRRSMLLWWPTFTIAATMWWLVPLLLLGKYSPPFLDFIETAAVTTGVTTVFDAVRGTSNWVAYVDAGSRAGFALLSQPYLCLNSSVLMFFGLMALMLPALKHRRFLVYSLLVGLLMVTFGHTGAVSGWFSIDRQALLDGVLAPLRNVHKFDPVIRLPVVIALSLVVEESIALGTGILKRTPPRTRLARLTRPLSAYGVPILIAVALAGSTMPGPSMKLTPAGEAVGVPGYWREAADWLGNQPKTGTTLLAPGSTFGTYVWGTPRDEPMQAIATSQWAVRNAIPLAQLGNIRMLTAIQDRFARGQGSVGLTDALRRAGIRFVLLRNDLQRTPDFVDPVLTHQALSDSPGIRLVKRFGPPVGGDPVIHKEDRRVVINDSWQTRYSALEIYELEGGGQAYVAAKRPPLVIGGPEDLLDIADRGILASDDPTVLATSADPRRAPKGNLVLTDGFQDRKRMVNSITSANSGVISPGDRSRLNAGINYSSDNERRWMTTARYLGAKSITVSSSAADSGFDSAAVPYAAVDRDADTGWSSSVEDQSPWWEITWKRPLPIDEIVITTPESSADPQIFEVKSSNGARKRVSVSPGTPTNVRLSDKRTDWLRLQSVTNNGRPASIAEVEVSGVAVTRELVLPPFPAIWGIPDVISLQASIDRGRSCVLIAQVDRCAYGRVGTSEEGGGFQRSFTLPAGSSYEMRARARSRGGEAMSELLQRQLPINVTSSTSAVADPRGSALMAVDGSPETTWVASPFDPDPRLKLSWLGQQTVSGLKIQLDANAPARRPTSLTLSWPGGERRIKLDASGAATFHPITTDRLEIALRTSDRSFGIGFDLSRKGLGIGISDLEIKGLSYLPIVLSDQPIRRACGTGPSLEINGKLLDTAIDLPPAQLLGGGDLMLRVCGEDLDNGVPLVQLRAGSNRVSSRSTDAFALSDITMNRVGVRLPLETQSAAAIGDDFDHGQAWSVQVGPSAQLINHRANANAGWRLDADRRSVAPMTVDGWQQGWWVDQGTSARLQAEFAPDVVYRIGLLLGAVCAILLLGAVLFWRKWGPTDSAPVDEVPVQPIVDRCLPLTAIALLGGWWGLGMALLGVTVFVVLDRRRTQALTPWILSLPVLVAGVGYALRPYGNPDGWMGLEAWPQLLMLLTMGGVVAGLSRGSFVPWKPRRSEATQR